MKVAYVVSGWTVTVRPSASLIGRRDRINLEGLVENDAEFSCLPIHFFEEIELINVLSRRKYAESRLEWALL